MERSIWLEVEDFMNGGGFCYVELKCSEMQKGMKERNLKAKGFLQMTIWGDTAENTEARM